MLCVCVCVCCSVCVGVGTGVCIVYSGVVYFAVLAGVLFSIPVIYDENNDAQCLSIQYQKLTTGVF